MSGYNFLSVAEGHSDVLLAVDGDEVDQAAESFDGEFCQGIRCFLKGCEKVLDACLVGLRSADLVVQFVNPGFELLVALDQGIVLLLVVSLVLGYMRILVDGLLDRIGDGGRFDQKVVTLGFQVFCVEEEPQHLSSIGDNFRLCGEKLIRGRQEGCLDLIVCEVWGGAVLVAVVLVIALPDDVAVLVV